MVFSAKTVFEIVLDSNIVLSNFKYLLSKWHSPAMSTSEYSGSLSMSAWQWRTVLCSGSGADYNCSTKKILRGSDFLYVLVLMQVVHSLLFCTQQATLHLACDLCPCTI